jgi:recombination protein RecT
MNAKTQLKAVATGQAVAEHKPQTLATLLMQPAVKAQIAMALPKHMTADRLARIALTEVRKNPKLAQCDQHSFLGAVMQCAQLGLEPGNALGHAYILPFDKRAKVDGRWQVVGTDATLIIGYRGMLDLARRSGQILSIEARAVYERDTFHVAFGLNPDLKHEPNWDAADRGELKFVYAVAKLKDGGTQFEVMSRAQVEAVRDGSQGWQSAKRYAKDGQINSPWATHFDEMARKTVMRRLFKYLPISIELATAIYQDERGERGEDVGSLITIDAEPPAPPAVDQSTEEIAAPDEQKPNWIGAQTGMTYAAVADALNAAADTDALDAARDLIRSVRNEQQQGELHQLASKRLAEIGGAV